MRVAWTKRSEISTLHMLMDSKNRQMRAAETVFHGMTHNSLNWMLRARRLTSIWSRHLIKANMENPTSNKANYSALLGPKQSAA